MRCDRLGFAGLCLALAIGAVPAQAAVVTFLGENLTPNMTVSGDPLVARDAWASQVTNIQRSHLDHRNDGDHARDSVLHIGFVGDGGMSDLVVGELRGGVQIDDLHGAGRFATSGNQFLETFKPGDDGTGGNFSLTFQEGVSAFGFFATDVGDFDNRLYLTLVNGQKRHEIEVQNTRGTKETMDGALLFFGFVDTEHTWKTIEFYNEPGKKDRFGFDDFVIGQIAAVPLPAGLPLALAGLGGLFLLRRRSLARRG